MTHIRVNKNDFADLMLILELLGYEHDSIPESPTNFVTDTDLFVHLNEDAKIFSTTRYQTSDDFISFPDIKPSLVRQLYGKVWVKAENNQERNRYFRAAQPGIPDIIAPIYLEFHQRPSAFAILEGVEGDPVITVDQAIRLLEGV